MIKPTNIFEHKINEIFSKKEKDNVEVILQVMTLIMYNTLPSTDVIELYKLVDLNSFIKILNLFSGKEVKFPKKEYLKNSLLLAILYYYREIKELEWSDIKKMFPFEISPVSYGIQIRNLDNFIKQKIQEIYRKEYKED